ncbi:MAG: hypothetical protein B6D35_00410 [Candidatus Brocadia sp. UTAMX2]|jgi:uncharacterized protein with ParB-like and HNH nuclease domain|nr:MAG: hypothetical protein B6D35_00410 [Candidatus Brocadia sp. UTAMX2]
MSRISHQSLSLSQLKNKFEDRVFAIPEIQRLYVWDKNRVCQLMDSIFRHYPIGVSLIWKTHGIKNVDIRANNKTILPPFNLKNRHAEFVIDGQQRLSSLYGILFGITPQSEKNAKIDFQKIFFNLDRKAEKRFVYSKRICENTSGYLKLYEVLNTRPSILTRLSQFEGYTTR